MGLFLTNIRQGGHSVGTSRLSSSNQLRTTTNSCRASPVWSPALIIKKRWPFRQAQHIRAATDSIFRDDVPVWTD